MAGSFAGLLVGGVLDDRGVNEMGSSFFKLGEMLCGLLSALALLVALRFVGALLVVATGDCVVYCGECLRGEGVLAGTPPGLVVPASCLNRCE